MPTLYIHIGMHKTGSTAIQNLLSENTDVLLERGVFSPDRQMRKDPGRGYKRHHDMVRAIRRPQKVRRADNILRIYRDILSNCTHDNIIVSSEEFCLMAPDHVRRLYTELPRIPTRIVVYVRNQVDWLESVINQYIKSRRQHDISYIYSELSYRIDYFSMIEGWANVFGRGNIIVRVYDQIENAAVDFLRILGVEDISGITTLDIRENTKLSAQAVELKRIANAVLGHDDGLRRAIERLQASRGWSTKAELLSPEQVEDVVARAREPNANLWAHYLPPDTPPFSFPRRATAAPSALTMEDITYAMFTGWAVLRYRLEALQGRVDEIEKQMKNVKKIR